MKYKLNKKAQRLMAKFDQFTELATFFGFDDEVSESEGKELYSIAEDLDTIEFEHAGSITEELYISILGGNWDSLIKEYLTLC